MSVGDHVLRVIRQEASDTNLAAIKDSDLLRAMAELALKDIDGREAANLSAVRAALVAETSALREALASSAETNRLHSEELEAQRSVPRGSPSRAPWSRPCWPRP